MIGGDPEAIRRLAQQVRRSAGDLAGAASRVRDVTNVEWRSSAASTFRDQLEQRGRDFDEVVQRFDDLASELDHLAATLHNRQAFLLEAYDAARDAAEDALELAGETAEKTWDYVDDFGGWAKDNLGRLF